MGRRKIIPNRKQAKPETQKQLEAFELYFAQGDKRSLTAVAKHMKTPLNTIKSWHTKLSWGKKLIERNKILVRKLEKKTEKVFLKTREDFNKELMMLYKATLNSLTSKIVEDENGQGMFSIDPKSIADLEKLTNMTIKLAQVVQGDTPSEDKNGVHITFIQNNAEVKPVEEVTPIEETGIEIIK